MKAKDNIRRLAETIAQDLFTNGSAERAQRLVLTIDKPVERNLGGLGEGVVADRVERLLRAESCGAIARSPEQER